MLRLVLASLLFSTAAQAAPMIAGSTVRKAAEKTVLLGWVRNGFLKSQRVQRSAVPAALRLRGNWELYKFTVKVKGANKTAYAALKSSGTRGFLADVNGRLLAQGTYVDNNIDADAGAWDWKAPKKKR